MRIYNTMGGRLEEFEPAKKGKVNMYVCGLTPYDSMHIGHARTFVAFDIVRRWLGEKGYAVYFVQNVTDVDDKIIRRAGERGEEPLALSARFDAESREELAALGVMNADVYPKVSEQIPQIIALIEKIIKNGFAYANESGVYFDVAKFAGYGKLSGQEPDGLKSGARIEVDEKKRNPVDFALWKAAKPGELWFESPWGMGRPGWHIECSAMSMHYLKGGVDIHGGARDLVFPHHENEIAQSEAASGGMFAKYWMHSGFLTVNGEKMAKSLGNFITVKEALSKCDANSLRLFFSLAHYRSPVDFSWGGIEVAGENVKKLLICLSELEKIAGEKRAGLKGAANALKGKFAARMDEDFDTPGAAAVMFEEMKEANKFIESESGKKDAVAAAGHLALLEWMLGVFGIMREVAAGNAGEQVTDEMVVRMLRERAAAREKGDFGESDRIRTELAGKGVVVEDRKGGGVRWRRDKEMGFKDL